MDPLDDGIRLFNAERFFDAHEAWETLWLADKTPEREFLQGLIQLAAAYHHVQRGTYRGGVRLFDAALRRLAMFPEFHKDVDRAAAVEAATRDRETIARGETVERFPKLARR